MMHKYHPTADRLEAFVEGGLDEAERVVVESHLLGCPTCETAVEEWRTLFATLSTLVQFEPKPGFADRVMAGVRYSPKMAWQQQAARLGEMLTRIAPKSSFGWAMASALMALPALLGGGAAWWLMQRDNVTPGGLWAMATSWVTEGVQGIGSTAITALVQTDVAVWLTAQVTAFLGRAGVDGLGVVAAVAGGATMLSVWILYRNLFRTPARESHYVSYSF